MCARAVILCQLQPCVDQQFVLCSAFGSAFCGKSGKIVEIVQYLGVLRDSYDRKSNLGPAIINRKLLNGLFI